MSLKRDAAKAGTDTASFYCISPEMLYKLIQSKKWEEVAEKAWGKNPPSWESLQEEDFPHDKKKTDKLDDLFNRLDFLIRAFGGAVFHMGKDGIHNVSIANAVHEWGYTKPYGTDDFENAIKKVAFHHVKKQGKNLPADVERYVKEHQEQGMDEGKSWAIAWSRYCRKNDKSPHCKQEGYFKGQGKG